MNQQRILVVDDSPTALRLTSELLSENGFDVITASDGVEALEVAGRDHPNLIVLDFGTATTFDVVGRDGAYVGGVIAPGINLSLEALHNAAAALPHVDISKPQAVIGTNTVACMQSGVVWGYIGLLREICARIKAERGTPLKVISTGGLAPLFQQAENLFDAFEDDLTIHGLTVIYEHNKGPA